jgi:hypothetical protein
VKYENHPHYAVLKACACGTCNKNRVACGCADCLPYATKNRKKRKRKAKELNAFAVQAGKLAAADEIINGDPGLRAKTSVPVVAKSENKRSAIGMVDGAIMRLQQEAQMVRKAEAASKKPAEPGKATYAHPFTNPYGRA